MSSESDMKSMIMSFRVSELQVLLGFAGRNKTGRKQDLQARALELLKLHSAPIQMKIRDLHKRYPGATSSAPLEKPVPVPPAMVPQPQQPSYSSSHNKLSSYNTGHQSSSSSMGGSRNDMGSSSSSKSFTSSSSSSAKYPMHPDVRLKPLPFYDVLGELVKPTSLVPLGTGRFQEGHYSFYLTPSQAQDVAMSRDIRPGSKMEFGVQVQLRFCLLETSCEQEDNFPPSICVKVNGKICPLPNPIPTNKPGVEPKRPSRPVNMTGLCRLSPTVANNINITWASEYGRAYSFGVYLVRKLTSSTLLQRLRSQGVRNAEHTRALIKEKLSQDADSEIATTSLRVSLMCPLGKMRMQVPCRAMTCTHLQCFDASLFLQMNEKKPTWICPVCDKSASFKILVIDGLFLEIIQTAQCNEIQFLQDGSWSPLMPKKDTPVVNSLVTKTEPRSVSPIASCSSSSSSSSSNASAPEPAEKKPTKSKAQVIDLTLSSDESDDFASPPPSKMQRRGSSPDSNKSSSPARSSSADSLKALPVSRSKSPVVINLDSPSPPSTPNPPTNSSCPPLNHGSTSAFSATTASESRSGSSTPVYVRSSVLTPPRVGVVLQMSPHESNNPSLSDCGPATPPLLPFAPPPTSDALSFLGGGWPMPLDLDVTRHMSNFGDFS